MDHQSDLVAMHGHLCCDCAGVLHHAVGPDHHLRDGELPQDHLLGVDQVSLLSLCSGKVWYSLPLLHPQAVPGGDHQAHPGPRVLDGTEQGWLHISHGLQEHTHL